jgi:D-alanyl-D-alanine carboxypeptidase (penicillin-binding protein 5/6)
MRQVRQGERPVAVHPRADDRVSARTLSWALFLFVTLVALVASLARIATIGPGGRANVTAPRASSGALPFVSGQPPSVSAQAAFVYDAGSGFVFYAKNADAELPMASTTKVMTMLLAVERGSLNQVITVGPDAAALVRPDSSYMGLSAGEKLSLEELLYGLVLPSGNDAAVAIADAIGGSEGGFVDMMNKRAQELGLTHTHFVTPHGLDEPGHYTTARDLAILSGVAMKNPTLVKITSVLHYSIPTTPLHKAYELQTGNDLLAGARSPYPGAIGVKPGFTGAAGYCMAFAAIRHGHLIVGTVLNEPSWQVRITDMRALLDWGFSQDSIPPAPAAVPWSYPSPNI